MLIGLEQLPSSRYTYNDALYKRKLPPLFLQTQDIIPDAIEPLNSFPSTFSVVAAVVLIW